MNKEQGLKLLLDSIEQDERFALVEYEAIFTQQAEGYRLDSDFTLYLNGTRLYTLSKEEIKKKEKELVLDVLINRLYDVLTVEVLDLKKEKKLEIELRGNIELKHGRLKRQKRNPNLTEKQRKSLDKEIKSLEKKMEAVQERISRLHEISQEVRLICLFEELRRSA